MSGLDEQQIDFPLCPECKRIPRYWTLTSCNGRRIWFYNETYAEGELNNGQAVSFDDDELGVDWDTKLEIFGEVRYVYCSICAEKYYVGDVYTPELPKQVFSALVRLLDRGGYY